MANHHHEETGRCGLCRFRTDGQCHLAPPQVTASGKAVRPTVSAMDMACLNFQERVLTNAQQHQISMALARVLG